MDRLCEGFGKGLIIGVALAVGAWLVAALIHWTDYLFRRWLGKR